MKFNVGDHVSIKGTQKAGEIIMYRHDAAYVYGDYEETHKYFIRYSPWGSAWFDEESLVRINEFTDEFEIGLIDQLIDSYLLHYDKDKAADIQKLYEYKQKLLKGTT